MYDPIMEIKWEYCQSEYRKHPLNLSDTTANTTFLAINIRIAMGHQYMG